MITFSCPDAVHTEALMQKALLNYFDWRQNPCFFNSGLLAWESDLLVLSKAGYMFEVEIKTDWQDWKNDHKKDKWGQLALDRYWQWIKHFSYAVPRELYDAHGLPDSLSSTAGVLVVTAKSGGRLPKIEVIREAVPNFNAKKLSRDMTDRLYRSTYFKLNTRFLTGK